ncbi:MAG: hypothetical protein V5B40_24360 [Candidatus Accumulibacter meliphilus]|jgi:ABC-type molybdate transport system ATPase subunit|uniref:hypothetical protein n=1 Tax=Candidatus Accumulibacter meliphilus TaxID=2211374 RepID=UPI002FC2F58C
MLREMASREYAIPGTRRRHLSEKTIQAWYLAFCDGRIDVSRHDERVRASVRGNIHARDVGLALQAQIRAVALLA